MDRSKLSISVFYIICNSCRKNDLKLNLFNKSKYYIKKKLSLENILKTFISFDIFKLSLLDEVQYKYFNSIPKQNLSRLMNIDENSIKDFMRLREIDANDLENDYICKRISEFYNNNKSK